KGSTLKKIPYRIYLIFFLLIAYVFFRADSLPLAFSYIGNMFAAGRTGAAAFADDAFLRYIDSVKILLPAAVILCTPFAKWVSGKCRDGAVKTIVRGVLTLAIFALCVILTVSGSYNPFIYFNF
ncbi:MAG: hypothetical protein HUJ75_08890, partial [Parasporobacterium sp.]|nr:hypothetical protein [Parasporobacterium sp.]